MFFKRYKIKFSLIFLNIILTNHFKKLKFSNNLYYNLKKIYTIYYKLIIKNFLLN